jgi:hypothetical protein
VRACIKDGKIGPLSLLDEPQTSYLRRGKESAELSLPRFKGCPLDFSLFLKLRGMMRKQ